MGKSHMGTYGEVPIPSFLWWVIDSRWRIHSSWINLVQRWNSHVSLFKLTLHPVTPQTSQVNPPRRLLIQRSTFRVSVPVFVIALLGQWPQLSNLMCHVQHKSQTNATTEQTPLLLHHCFTALICPLLYSHGLDLTPRMVPFLKFNAQISFWQHIPPLQVIHSLNVHL